MIIRTIGSATVPSVQVGVVHEPGGRSAFDLLGDGVLVSAPYDVLSTMYIAFRQVECNMVPCIRVCQLASLSRSSLCFASPIQRITTPTPL